MQSIKKCKYCGQWSEWKEQPGDHCIHCHKLLDEEAFKAFDIKKDLDTKKMVIEDKSFYLVKPSDGLLMIIIRKTAWAGYMLYVGIVAFFIWLVAFISG